jgi:hypothetical protein
VIWGERGGRMIGRGRGLVVASCCLLNVCKEKFCLLGWYSAVRLFFFR